MLRLLAPRTSRTLLFPRRFVHSTPPPLRRPRRIFLYTSLSALSLSLLSLHPSLQGLIYADAPQTVSLAPGEEYSDTTLQALLRSYVVFTMCSFPKLVDASPWFMDLAKVPVIGAVVRGVIRVTFFDHFVGGDTVEQTVPLISTLRHAKKGTLLAYSVEVDQSDATSGSPISGANVDSKKDVLPPHKQSIEEMLHSVDVAGDYEDTLQRAESTQARRTWVAVKLSALVPDPTSLVRLSAYITQRATTSRSRALRIEVPFPGIASPEDLALLTPSSTSSSLQPLTPEDITELRDLYRELRRLCTRAEERGVKIIVDAEYTWYQPGIDLFVRGLSGEFNRLDRGRNEQPLVYGTYQAYLRRTPSQIRAALEDARKHGFSLGVKLVRGAYHPYEVEAWNVVYGTSPSMPSGNEAVSISPDRSGPPVWEKKEDTDSCYNECVEILVDAVKRDIDTGSSTGSSSFSSPSSLKNWIPGWGSSASPPSAQTNTEAGPRPPTIGVLFGTHNWESCRHLLREFGKRGLVDVVMVPSPEGSSEEKKTEVETKGKEVVVGDDVVVRIPDSVVQRVAVGQLFGMSDDLTNYMVKRTVTSDGTPFVIKYVPYGPLAEAMPYLSRRAIENKSVLGGGIAVLERQRAGREIWKRVFGV